ncbi:MAG: hypothetical protein CO183_02645 [Candidatus Zambryskibacteria bacterium CG_4_9_14_3_um_filter_42_9]|uniref:Uncharacterized protein n=1 Tax=Candidatus Zambryskibacteria bacterium CG22_combo_CG10-13_8_21_14_all_42_17 TaxID=1975118 RepID=A0A2H0BDN9_9BACT|nr:MAG: hypothetical protein COX06_01900 [Candidatus Zambryskibacteria bacterium CG22_combo_CG10-13_8_21_14_all_42_17]PJA36615.1 MAG: hypothetical protein CO183_02645 [Candidatus Zambryskibacteria bacterium CG_4_9_14_3_um_filter_42_9]
MLKVLGNPSKVLIPKNNGFIVRSKFVHDTDCEVKIKIGSISYNFKSWFLSGGTLIEDLKKDSILQYLKLRRSSSDIAIITELGGEVKAETTIYEMVYLLEGQGRGEEGILLNNGFANIFYVRDNAHILRSVFLIWDERGWFIDAHSIMDAHRGSCGCLVFSRV